MSNHATAAAEIKRAWLTAWQGGPLAAMPVEHQNLRFNQPATGPWGRLTLLTATTNPASLGTNRAAMERTPFILMLQVFIPEHGGTRPAMQAADAMRRLDRHMIAVPGLTVNFQTAGLTPAPNPGNTGFEAFNVEISGTYDTTWIEPTPPPGPPDE